MGKPVRRIGQWATVALSAALAAAGVIILRHALETPQPLKSSLPGEAFLYRWHRRSVFYKVLGSADAPPLVLLHTPAIGASASEMQYIMSPLAQMYRVYALDLLGFGHSDRPGVEYSATMYSALCQDFLRDVVQGPATLLASKLSCNYAISVAAAAPDLCAALVLISPNALLGELRPLPLRSFAEQPAVKALLYPLLSTRLAFLVARGREQASRDDFTQFHANTHQFGAEHASMALLAGKLAANTARQFAEIEQPVLMIWGTKALEDQRTVASLHEAAALAGPTNRNRMVELIQGAGLMVHKEQPEGVSAAIERWREESADELARAEARAYTLKSPAPQVEHTARERDPSSSVSAQTEAAQPGQVSISGVSPGTEATPPDPSSSAFQALPPTEGAEVTIQQNGLAEASKGFTSGAAFQTSFSAQNEKGSTQPEVSAGGQNILAYCVKCRQKREMLNVRRVTMKNGRPALRGVCAVCGTTLNRIGNAN